MATRMPPGGSDPDAPKGWQARDKIKQYFGDATGLDQNRATPKTKFETPSSVLGATQKRDAQKQKALKNALSKIKAQHPYIYSSGNLRDRINSKPPKMGEA